MQILFMEFTSADLQDIMKSTCWKVENIMRQWQEENEAYKGSLRSVLLEREVFDTLI
jgi:hypothetical protein